MSNEEGPGGSRKGSVDQGKPGGSRKGNEDQGKPGGSRKGNVDQGKPGGSQKGNEDQEKPGGSRKGSVDQGKPGGAQKPEQESNRNTGAQNSAQPNATQVNPAAPSTMDVLQTNLSQLLSRLSLASIAREGDTAPAKVIDDLTFNGLLEHWKTKGFRKIITLVGAGISTSAGIPDFRSPGSGIYDNLKKYNLPTPTDIFELDYFMENPKPFFSLAKELYPGSFIPTPAHYFIRLLTEKNLLVRHYTQNIDSLERIAGIPEEKLVEAHGTFHTNHCVECSRLYIKEWMKEKIFSDEMPVCDDCGGIVKPDIVFFGENLPKRFYDLPPDDFKSCDLLIIMGTSLEVYPFASLVDYVEPHCLRLFINKVNIDRFKNRNAIRDITFIGDCDEGVWQIADALGWKDELQTIIDSETIADLKKKGSKMDDEKRKRKTSKLPQQQ